MRRPLLLLLSALLVLPPALPAGASGYAVVGGEPAAPGAHPAAVALVRAEDPDPVAGQMCGGTAIGADLVLTAAHCFHDTDVTRWRSADRIRVVAGRRDLSADGGVERHGTDVWVHPSYDPRRRRFDVAVMRVDGPLDVPLQPLAAAGSPDPAGGDPAVVVGWGRTGQDTEQSSSSTSVLHEAAVTISDPATCVAAFEGTLDPQVHLCAGGDGTAEQPAPDACRGDSGGPLLLTDPDAEFGVQHGITSFGPGHCGVDEPGVYTRLVAVRGFIDDVVGGRLPPTTLPGPEPAGRIDPVRLAVDLPTTPVAQAVAASQAVFAAGAAELAVIARADGYADALAGSALGNGRGPILFTPSTGALDRATRAELQRAVPAGAVVYLLGGTAAVPAAVEQQLSALDYRPVRLAGEVREATAAVVATEIRQRQGGAPRPPYGTAILATSQAWPDAVVAGQLGAWWGYPILLTTPDGLHPAAREALAAMQLDRLLIVGGEGAVSEEVHRAAVELLGDIEVVRLAGATRTDTAIEVAAWQRRELVRRGEAAPDAVAIANVRSDDGYTHMLSATPLLAATAGVFLPVEGAAGDRLTPETVERFCGTGGLPVVIGGTDTVTDEVAAQATDLLAGLGCGPES